MAEIINLRQRRKQAARKARQKAADQDRIDHGRSKAGKQVDADNRALQADRLDGHRRDDRGDD